MLLASLFRRSNVKMLQNAVRKNMLISFGQNEDVMHNAIFGSRNILMVDEVKSPRPPAEPGEPEIIYPDIRVQHNEITKQNYVFFDKTFFDEMDQSEIDEVLYQFFNQVEMKKTHQIAIDIPQADGSVSKAYVDVEARTFSDTEEEKKEREAEKGEGSCDTTEEIAKAKSESKAQKTSIKEVSHDIDEQEKLKNPNYATAQAAFKKGESTSAASTFGASKSAVKIGSNDLKSIHQVEEILRYSIQGEDGGKSKTITPSKRLNIKAIITETSEKEYITRHGEEGKDIKINLIVDRSGSMHGQPTRESNILIAALNNLAFEYPELDVSIMFSESSNYFVFKLPVDNVDSKQLWKFSSTGDAEGLSRTINANWDRVKEAHLNFVYTDGNIYDEAIDKAYYKSQEVDLIGLYVNSGFSTDDIFRHYEKNSKYFTETIVRDNMVSLMNEVANKVVMSKDGR